MERSNKEAWLSDGAGDLKEKVVEDVPVPGSSVKVRALPAAYSNQANSESLEWKAGLKGEQIATVNQARLEVLKFAHGCIEPTFTVTEAEIISQKFGPAFSKVIETIDELSGITSEDVEEATARFQDERTGANGSDLGSTVPAGSAGPNLPT